MTIPINNLHKYLKTNGNTFISKNNNQNMYTDKPEYCIGIYSNANTENGYSIPGLGRGRETGARKKVLNGKQMQGEHVRGRGSVVKAREGGRDRNDIDEKIEIHSRHILFPSHAC